MPDDSLLMTGLGAIVSTVIGLVILRVLRYLEKRDKSKDEEVNTTVKHANEIIKQQLAQMIKDTSEKNQTVHIESNTQLKEELFKKISDEIQEVKDRIKTDVDSKTDIQSKVLLGTVSTIESKLTSMINSIDMKTSITTDTVTKIRSDILQIQKEIDNIFDSVSTPEKRRESQSRRSQKKKEISEKDDDNNDKSSINSTSSSSPSPSSSQENHHAVRYSQRHSFRQPRDQQQEQP